MTDSGEHNVAYIGGGSADVPAFRLINDCGDRARQSLTDAHARMMEGADEALLAMSEGADDAATQRLHFDAMRAIHCARPDIDTAFRTSLERAQTRFLARRGQAPDPAAGLGDTPWEWDFDPEATLLDGTFDDAHMDEALAISNMIAKVNNNTHHALEALNRRLATLLGVEAIDADSAPFAPGTVVNAFRDACQHLHAGSRVRLVVYELFDRFVLDTLPPLYDELNDFLRYNDVLPDLHASQSPASTGRAPATGDRASTRAVGDDADLAGLLQQLTGTSVEGIEPAPQALLKQLTRLQHRVARSHAPTVLTGGHAPSDTLVLRRLRESTLGGNVSHVNRLVIDMVALIFEQLLDDADLTAEFRALLAQLQIPVVKAALQDKTLFSRKDHPARQLIDTLGEAAALSLGESNGRLLAAARQAVQHVGTTFDVERTAFTEATEVLERAVKEHKYRVGQAEVDAKTLRERTERAAHGRLRAINEIRHHLAERAAPEVIADFLQRHWTNVLLLHYVRDGEDSPEWNEALRTLRLLLWSLETKDSPDERRRVRSTLPELVKRLRSGMETVSVPVEERKYTLEFLATCHRLVVHGQPATLAGAIMHTRSAGSPRRDPGSQDGESTETASLRAVVDQLGLPEHAVQALLSASDEADVDEPTVGDLEEIEPDPATDDAYVDYARQLTEGSWVTFREADGGHTCAKLAWISPVSGTYLFTTREGGHYADKTLHELAGDFRRGAARTPEAGSLVERAMSLVATHWDTGT